MNSNSLYAGISLKAVCGYANYLRASFKLRQFTSIFRPLSYGVSFCFALMMASAFNANADEAQTEAPGKKSFFLWTDNSITVLPYGGDFEVDPQEQSTVTFEHVHASSIGDLFMFVDMTKFHGVHGGDDDTWYGEISPRLSFSKIFDKDLSFKILGDSSLFEFKDVLFAMQYERGEDPDVAEAVLMGVGFDLDVREAGLLGPLGKFNYLQLNLYARAEKTEGVKHGFRDMQVTVAGAYPFNIGSAKFLVDGYFDWVLGLGSEEWSYHLNPQLKLDVGNFWNNPNKLYAGVEVDLWWNKYQIPDSSNFETDQQAASFLVKYHF
jgi:nucleoside-specific outer membrane channel protein Tsx